MIDTTGKTMQQVSDEIAAALIQQGERSMKSDTVFDGICAYDSGNGKHCAVGWPLEKDSEPMQFSGGVECLTVEFLPDQIGVNGEFIYDNKNVLSVLQNLHDLGSEFEKLQVIDQESHILGDLNKETESEVLKQVDKHDLVYFGDSFNCEPYGTSINANQFEIITL